jgi:hypothetical protein
MVYSPMPPGYAPIRGTPPLRVRVFLNTGFRIILDLRRRALVRIALGLTLRGYSPAVRVTLMPL